MKRGREEKRLRKEAEGELSWIVRNWKCKVQDVPRALLEREKARWNFDLGALLVRLKGVRPVIGGGSARWSSPGFVVP